MDQVFGRRCQLLAVCFAALTLLTSSPTPAAGADIEFAHGLYAERRYELAADEYEAFLRSNPESRIADEARFYLAECYAETNRGARALPIYQRLIDGTSGNRRYEPRSLVRLGELYFRQGNARSAIEHLEKFVKAYPSDKLVAHAATLLAESLIETKQYDRAEQMLARAADAAEPGGELTSSIRFAKARLAERQGNVERARDIYRELSADSKNILAADALLALGAIDYELGEYESALGCYRQLRSAFPKSPLAAKGALNEGLCLYQLRRYDDAAGSLHASARTYAADPLAPELLFHAALSEFRAGNHRDAMKSFLALTSTHPKNSRGAQSWYYYGSAALEAKDFAQVLGSYRRISATDPKSQWRDRAAVNVAKAVVADTSGSSRMAMLDRLLDEVNTPTQRERVRYYSALLLFDEKQYDQAIGRLHALLDTRIDEELRRDSLYLLGASLVRAGQASEAVAPLETVLAAGTQGDLFVPAFQSLSMALSMLEPTKRARELQDRLVKHAVVHPKGAALLTNLAERMYDRSRFADAGRIYEQMLAGKLAGDSRAKAIVGLAWCLYETDRFVPAFEQFKLAAATLPNNDVVAEARYMTGVVAEKLGKSDEAIEAFTRVMDDAKPSRQWFDAGLRLARLLAKSGRNSEADQTFRMLAERIADPKQRVIVLYERAWLAFENDRRNDAEKLFARLADEFPNDEHAAEALVKLAEIAYFRQEFAAAVEYTRRAEASAAPNANVLPAVFYRRGLAFYKQGDLKSARESFDSLLERFHDDSLAPAGLFWSAEIEFDERNAAEALERYQRLLKRPDGKKYRETARLRVAQCLLQAKRWTEAYERAADVVDQSQDSQLRGEAVYVQARVLQQQAKFDEARKAYQQIVGSAKTELAAKAQFMIGETHFHQRQHRVALKEFLKVEILYDFPVWQAMALFEIGQCHERLDETDPAIKAYEKLIREFPTSDVSKQAAKRLRKLK